MNPSSPSNPPHVIGLLGGIAAGKSFVAALFAERGLRVADADQMAQEVTKDPDILAQILRRFPGTAGPGGELDRKRLAEVVFGDPLARKDLEDITHPPVRERIREAMANAGETGVSLVLDVPLLLEGGLIDACDLCVFVGSTVETRRARAAERGWDAGELERREATQAPLDDKRERCSVTVQNDGDVESTRAQVAEVLASLAK